VKNLRVKANVNVLLVEEYKKKNGDVGFKTVVIPEGGDVCTVYMNERLELGQQELTLSAGVSKRPDESGKSLPLDELYIKIFKNKSE
jgi:hypothetical protein